MMRRSIAAEFYDLAEHEPEPRASAVQSVPPRRGRPKTRLLTISELADYLSVGRTTLYALLHDGMPAYRVGQVPRFDKSEVLAWLKARHERRYSAD